MIRKDNSLMRMMTAKEIQDRMKMTMMMMIARLAENLKVRENSDPMKEAMMMCMLMRMMILIRLQITRMAIQKNLKFQKCLNVTNLKLKWSLWLRRKKIQIKEKPKNECLMQFVDKLALSCNYFFLIIVGCIYDVIHFRAQRHQLQYVVWLTIIVRQIEKCVHILFKQPVSFN